MPGIVAVQSELSPRTMPEVAWSQLHCTAPRGATLMSQGSGPRDDSSAEFADLSSLGLLRRARGGDDEALNHLYERYLPLLRCWARGRLPGWARDLLSTEDLVQETLVRTFTQIRDFEPRRERGLHLYLREALRNRVREELRRVRRGPGEAVELDERMPGHEPSPLDDTMTKETWRRYEEALEGFPEDDRALLAARIDFGMSYRDIAEMTGKPSEDAARMAVSRLLAKVARAMGDDD